MSNTEERIITDIQYLIQENKKLKKELLLKEIEIKNLKILADIEEDCGEYVTRKSQMR